MRVHLLALLLLIPFAAAIEFSVQTPTQAVQGSTVIADILMNNTQTAYGYEITVSAPATFNGYLSSPRTAGTVNSFAQLTNTTIRTASVGAIAPGTGSVITLNYTASQSGQIPFVISAKAYSQNGSMLPVTTNNGQVNVQTSEIRVLSNTSKQRTTTINICTQSTAIDELNFTLAYDKTQIEISSSTATYASVPSGARVILHNIPEQTSCQNVAQFTFDIMADPGTAIPISIQNTIASPSTTLTAINGNITYNGYALSCQNVTAFRNTNATMQLTLNDHASLDQLKYSIDTIFTLSDITNSVGGIAIDGDDVTHTQITPQIAKLYLDIPAAQANGNYSVRIENILGDDGTENLTQDDLECFIEVITDCRDQDGDGYYIGDECNASLTEDCDDNSASVKPGATETCNSLDDDCDGSVDEGGVCTTSTGGSSGGGGGGSSSSSSSGSASAGSGGFSSWPTPIPEDEAIVMPEPQEQPIQTQAAPATPPQAEATGTKQGPKKVPLTAHVLGVLVLLGAGVLVAYEYVKHRKPH